MRSPPGFWKELWDFGGGQGGGRIIDIGRADPKRKGYGASSDYYYYYRREGYYYSDEDQADSDDSSEAA